MGAAIHERGTRRNESILHMLKPGAATRITVHLNEGTNTAGGFIHEQVFSLLFSRGVAVATVLRPEAGFGEHHPRQGDEGQEGERRHLPVQIQFVEEPNVVNALLPPLLDLVVDGLIKIHYTVVP